MEHQLELKDFFNFWFKIHDSILHLASLLNPEDLNYTFDPQLDSVGKIFIHISEAYNFWFGEIIKDGGPIEFKYTHLTVELIQLSLKESFDRCSRFLDNNSINLWIEHFTGSDSHGSYDNRLYWILWHLIEHDIHHRSQIKLQFKFLNKKINEQIYWES